MLQATIRRRQNEVANASCKKVNSVHMTLARSGDMINAMPHEKSYTLMHHDTCKKLHVTDKQPRHENSGPDTCATVFLRTFALALGRKRDDYCYFFLTNETSGNIDSSQTPLSPLLYDHKDGSNLVLFQNSSACALCGAPSCTEPAGPPLALRQ